MFIGVGGANFHAPDGSAVFVTEDSDLFLPPDPENLVQTWSACEGIGLELWAKRLLAQELHVLQRVGLCR
jgi:hypothetical protein